jgi:hypothetical protein
MCEVNSKPHFPPLLVSMRLNVTIELLLSNFLDALSLASIKPRRILLQTGGKNYGYISYLKPADCILTYSRLHLGPAAVPHVETAPRVLIEPNFYYVQEDYLWSFCERNDIGWNVIRPSNIIGAVPDAAMNLCFPLAVYASVCKHLGQPLDFPGDLGAWETIQDQSTAFLNAYLAEWVVLTDAAKNEAFNASDSSPFTWGHFWLKLAAWYDMDYTKPDPAKDVYHEFKLPYDTTPRGYMTASSISLYYRI